MDSINNMKKLGYAFNSQGQLRKIASDGEITNEPFQFNVSDKHLECQAHYEELGAAITDYIYYLLEKQDMIRLPVPLPTTAITENGTFIFATNDYDMKENLLLLIHGSGAVRAGQWARSLIINENIDTGSQIPYIERAKSRGFGVLVLNTNDNYSDDNKKIPHSSSAEEHAKYVWDKYIAPSKVSNVVIVAHSYGGVVTVALADQLKKEFEKKVKAIAFTDSVHGYSNVKISEFMKKNTLNWISSSSPLDAPMKTPDYDIPRLSAGHPKHEMTSYACMESVFKFIDEKLSKK